jgi:hypothetical protein
MMIVEAIEREIFNEKANFRQETVLLPLNRLLAFCIACFVRTVRGQSVCFDRSR